jgi:hypothetical protein
MTKRPYNLANHNRYNAEFEKSPEQVRKREERNTARRREEKKVGKAALKGKDVDHKKPLAAGGSNKDSNTRVISEEKNRGWRKGKHGKDSYKPSTVR